MTLDQITDQLEKRLMDHPLTANCSNPYLTGYIEAMMDAGHLSGQEGAMLYFQYANPETANILSKKLL